MYASIQFATRMVGICNGCMDTTKILHNGTNPIYNTRYRIQPINSIDQAWTTPIKSLTQDAEEKNGTKTGMALTV